MNTDSIQARLEKAVKSAEIQQWQQHVQCSPTDITALLSRVKELEGALGSMVGRFGGSSVCALDTAAITEARRALAQGEKE